jgi:hypothetical protein
VKAGEVRSLKLGLKKLGCELTAAVKEKVTSKARIYIGLSEKRR